MFVPFLRHWYVGDGEPFAAAEIVTDEPTAIDAPEGCEVNTGAVPLVVVPPPVLPPTVSTAPLLVTEPAEFVATTVYVPASLVVRFDFEYDALVAPEMFVPFLRHWYVGDGEPLAAAEIVTDDPTAIDALEGCEVNTGAVPLVVVPPPVLPPTVSTAPLLVTEPAEFVATTVYVPASPVVRFDFEYDALVAPEMFVPFLRHWYVGDGEPLAAAEIVTDDPTAIDALEGCEVNTGAVPVVVPPLPVVPPPPVVVVETASVPVSEIVDPAELLSETEYTPLSVSAALPMT
jgi:hypothetical protein